MCIRDRRDAIHRARLRIEGSFYQTNTQSEGYVKYHSAISTAARTIAQSISEGKASKPTELDRTLWARFIDMMNELYVDDAGKLQCKIPF